MAASIESSSRSSVLRFFSSTTPFASPRGTIALDRCTRAHAWLHGRDYATPEDVHAIAADVLRHRVLLSYEAEAEGVDADKVIALLLERVPLPETMRRREPNLP